MRHKAHAPHPRHETSLHCGRRDASFARSFDPCTSILTMLRGVSVGGGATASASRLGKPGSPGGTSTGVGTNGRSAARHVTTALAREKACHVEKEGDRGLRPCEDQEPRLGCPHVVT
jgi:hypothetical protein